MEKTKMPELEHAYYSERYICEVLQEMRTALKVLNFSYFKPLIEEAQLMADRMESKLEEYKSIKIQKENIKKLTKAKEALLKEVKELIKKRDFLEGAM